MFKNLLLLLAGLLLLQTSTLAQWKRRQPGYTVGLAVGGGAYWLKQQYAFFPNSTFDFYARSPTLGQPGHVWSATVAAGIRGNYLDGIRLINWRLGAEIQATASQHTINRTMRDTIVFPLSTQYLRTDAQTSLTYFSAPVLVAAYRTQHAGGKIALKVGIAPAWLVSYQLNVRNMGGDSSLPEASWGYNDATIKNNGDWIISSSSHSADTLRQLWSDSFRRFTARAVGYAGYERSFNTVLVCMGIRMFYDFSNIENVNATIKDYSTGEIIPQYNYPERTKARSFGAVAEFGISIPMGSKQVFR